MGQLAVNQRKMNRLLQHLILVVNGTVCFLIFVYLQLPSGQRSVHHGLRTPVAERNSTFHILPLQVAEGNSTFLAAQAQGKITPNIPVCSEDYKQRITSVRKKRMREVCSKYNVTTKPHPLLFNMVVDDKRKIFYCVVPKVACSNWKGIVVETSEKYHKNPEDLNKKKDYVSVHETSVLNKFGLRILPVYEKKFDDYYKFLFIRHPLDRLYSAYKDKMNQYDYQQQYGRYIIRTFRNNPTQHALETGAGVTFQEFVSFLTHHASMKDEFEQHWLSHNNLCHPCSIEYDFIGAFENIGQDSECVINHITEDDIHFPQAGWMGGTTGKIKDDKHIQYEFGHILVKQMQSLKDIYKIDCEMFGYDCDKMYGPPQ